METTLTKTEVIAELVALKARSPKANDADILTVAMIQMFSWTQAHPYELDAAEILEALGITL